MEDRLQNILSHRGVASRRHAAELIEGGRVAVNGKIVTEPGARFDPDSVKIYVDGKRINAEVERKRTIVLYKPVGVLSSVSDPFGGRTVIDIIRGKVSERLVPVGRLDKDSEGLLLLSNDGDLTLKLTHPRFEHVKTYVVRAAGKWNDDKLATLRSALVINGEKIRPCQVELLRIGDNNVHLLLFKLREGKKRQIRYMCSEAHLVVLSLKRVAVGAFRLPSELRPGEFRDLRQDEIARLFEEPVDDPSAWGDSSAFAPGAAGGSFRSEPRGGRRDFHRRDRAGAHRGGAEDRTSGSVRKYDW